MDPEKKHQLKFQVKVFFSTVKTKTLFLAITWKYLNIYEHLIFSSENSNQDKKSLHFTSMLKGKLNLSKQLIWSSYKKILKK